MEISMEIRWKCILNKFLLDRDSNPGPPLYLRERRTVPGLILVSSDGRAVVPEKQWPQVRILSKDEQLLRCFHFLESVRFLVLATNGQMKAPLLHLVDFVSSACKTCKDFLAETFQLHVWKGRSIGSQHDGVLWPPVRLPTAAQHYLTQKPTLSSRLCDFFVFIATCDIDLQRCSRLRVVSCMLTYLLMTAKFLSISFVM